MADKSWEHAADARMALNAIVTDPEHGVAALSSPRTMSNLLKDLLPDAPREKNLLVAAAEAGLADTLRQHVSQGMDSSTAIRLTASSFSERSPLTPDACSWVAGEIAVALGISSPAEIGGPGGPAGPGGPGGPGQPDSARSAASEPGASYPSSAPTRDYARPQPAGIDSAVAPGSLPPGAGFGPASPGYAEAQVPSNPPSYAPGPVAGYQQPPAYPQPGYQPGVPAWQGGGRQTAPATNGLAIAALICGVVQFVGFWLLGTIPAIVCGHIARRQIRQRGEQGAGMALAGLILGYAGLALTVIVVIIIILVAVHSNSSANY
jgi:hypothetical protein